MGAAAAAAVAGAAVEEVGVAVPAVGGDVGLVDDRGAGVHGGPGERLVGAVVADDLDQAGDAAAEVGQVAELVAWPYRAARAWLLVLLVGGGPRQLGESGPAGAVALGCMRSHQAAKSPSR